MQRRRIECIEETANRVITENETRDPFRIAARRDILISYGKYRDSLGFCAHLDGAYAISMNQDADDYTARSACAHELGHILLGHLENKTFDTFRRSDLTNMRSVFEQEANCFGAALLLRDQDAVEALRECGDLFASAMQLRICPELLYSKILILNSRGYTLPVPEMPSGRDWHRYIRLRVSE